MQLGSVTVPLLPLAAVLGAGVLVVLVLWGVWRVRRTPAPAPLPLEPPRTAADPQPSHADWTGEAAGGPADPPPPARVRTVADAVAERGADTGPLLRVPAYAGAVAVASGAGRHAAPDDDEGSLEALFAPADERPDPATLARGRDPERTAAVPLAAAPSATAPSATAPAPASVAPADPLPPPRPTPRPRPTGLRRARGAVRATDPGGAASTPADSPTDSPAAGEAGAHDAAAVSGAAATGTGATSGPAGPDAPAGPDTPAGTDPGSADPASPPVPEWPVARLRIVDDLTAVTGTDVTGADAVDTGDAAADPSATPSTVAPAPATPREQTPPGPLPPWSAERSEPVTEDLPAASAIPTPPVPPRVPDPSTPPTGSEVTARVTPEPVSRAVQQALAARAVQRARLRNADGVPEPQPDTHGGDPQQELPLAVVPTAGARTPVAADAKDRLLGVLLEDPARAVDATERLDDTRGRIAELDEVLRRRRDDLAGAVRHLHECGLDPAQIGRLSGMAVDDVRTILDGEDAER